jgi:hypothetical protein
MLRFTYLPLLVVPYLSCSTAKETIPTFTGQEIDGNVSVGYGLAIGDMDGDGKSDILLADAKEFVWYRNPTWERQVFAKLPGTRDNVCLATEDIDGDGKVEIAVGANWNPGETKDEAKSGSVHYLRRPKAAGDLWQPVELPHEPTVHRMRWVKFAERGWSLVVLPLHGRENRDGAGALGVKIQAYFPGKDASVAADWKLETLSDSLHVTHNLDRQPAADGPLIIGSKEGAYRWDHLGAGQKLTLKDVTDSPQPVTPFPGIGEIRWLGSQDIAAIEPFHGNVLAVYTASADKLNYTRRILDSTLAQGHALGCGDLLGTGQPQIVAGWREPNAAKQFGVKIYWQDAATWKSAWVDENHMACEDLKVADLNGDGRLDIIAAGRSTKNLKIYWNK